MTDGVPGALHPRVGRCSDRISWPDRKTLDLDRKGGSCMEDRPICIGFAYDWFDLFFAQHLGPVLGSAFHREQSVSYKLS